MIEFIRGICTPVRTVSIPASARMLASRAGYSPSRSRTRYRKPAAGVVEVHDQVTDDLGDPRCGRMRRRTQNPDAAGGVFGDGQHVQPGAGQGDCFEEAAAMIASTRPRRNVAHVVEVRSGAGSIRRPSESPRRSMR
jgi:hypothetical protein